MTSLTRQALAVLAIGAMSISGTLDAQRPVGSASRQLTLEEALRLAEATSEEVVIARAGTERARGEQIRARSSLYPQLSGSASYQRALASQFEGIQLGGGSTGPLPRDCTTFTPNPALPVQQRVDSLEALIGCLPQLSNPFAGFSELPFGQPNTYRAGLSASQTLFAGGRAAAGIRAAGAGTRAAEVGFSSARAQLALDVAQAYYDAALSERLLAIAESTLMQTDTTLAQVRLAREVGTQPEFELLRAQVTRDNQRPVVIQRRADRELAFLRLQQLLNLPYDTPLVLTTSLDDETLPPPVRFALAPESEAGDTAIADRAPVRQAAASVEAQQELLRVTRGARLPSIAITSDYAKIGFTQTGFPDWGRFRNDWTIAVGMSIPLFTGFRQRGDEVIARANLMEAQARHEQVRELAALDARNTLARLSAAEASWQASTGTVSQAARAYTIAEVRYTEGLSTQTELSDSRILLQQAQANRAVAARDLQIARLRLALLPDLPLGAGAAQSIGASQMSAPRQQPQMIERPGAQASGAPFAASQAGALP